MNSNPKLSATVTEFLEKMNHPLRNVIEELRALILSANDALIENVKWNGPNYTFNDDDRITMRIHPPKQIQLVFHRGAKKQQQPPQRLIQDDSRLLTWRENDRAVANFKTTDRIVKNKESLILIINSWLNASI